MEDKRTLLPKSNSLRRSAASYLGETMRSFGPPLDEVGIQVFLKPLIAEALKEKNTDIDGLVSHLEARLSGGSDNYGALYSGDHVYASRSYGAGQVMGAAESQMVISLTDKDDDKTPGGGINELPDDILHQILYFTGMKQAVQTSMLSKRWKYVWRYMPQLNFDASEIPCKGNPNRKVIEFAIRAVMWRGNHELYPVRKVSFTILNDVEKHALFRGWLRIMMWVKRVKTVVAAGLEEIELFCVRRHRHEAELPQVVRLFMYPRTSRRKFAPRSIEIWNHRGWEGVAFCEGYQLENVLIANCAYKRIRISQNELKVLKLWHCGIPNCDIRVFAPNLRFLECRRIPSVSGLHLEIAPDSIVDAVLDFTICPEGGKVVDDLIKMLNALHRVKSLALCYSIIKCLNMHRDVVERHCPTFHNLKRVVLLSETSSSNQPIAVERHVLERWPNLEALEKMQAINALEDGRHVTTANARADLQGASSGEVRRRGRRPSPRRELLLGGLGPVKLERTSWMLMAGVLGAALVVVLYGGRRQA